MKRSVEPELMIGKQQCKAYNLADRSRLHNLFLTLLPYNIGGNVADLGCGPGEFTKILIQQYDVSVDAYDGSAEMLKLAESQITHSQVKFIKSDITDIDRPNYYDTIVCVNTLHHIHAPEKLWVSIHKITKRNFLVIDFIRPNSEHELNDIITPYRDNKLLYKDFKNSLKSAFSLIEIQEQVKEYNCNVIPINNIPGTPLQLVAIRNYG